MLKITHVTISYIKAKIANVVFFFLYIFSFFLISLGEAIYKILKCTIQYPAKIIYFIFYKLFILQLSKFIGFKLHEFKKGITHSYKASSVIFKSSNYNTSLYLFRILNPIKTIINLVASNSFRYFTFGFIFCLFSLFIYQTYNFIYNLPSPKYIGEVNFAQSTHLYDRHGRLLYEIYRNVNRTKIKLKDVSPAVLKATIAIEDKHFYNHKGISFFGGILRAMKESVETGKLQGGSTITQQLVKSALLSPERTINRKIKEIILAIWTERIYTKDKIIEMYLNQVSYGGSAYGIEEAANVYFNKKANYLTLSESALLAGLTRAPSVYSPLVNPELALKRRNQVLKKMYDAGFISKQEKNQAQNEPINIQHAVNNIRAPHFVMYTRDYLEREYGSKKVEESGFNVQTTLDLEIQNMAEKILFEEIGKLKPYGVSNGGIIVLDPNTGEILAMVGSVDYFTDKFGAFNVTTAQRQPGSALKPMLYSLALARGFTAATPLSDSPVIYKTPGSKPYRPSNYDRRFHGKVSIRQALANSYNIPAVKVLNSLGVQTYVDFARHMGIDTWGDSSRFGLSLALGGGEVTLLDISKVYGVFANGGYKVETTPIIFISDSRKRKIHELTSNKTRVLDENIAFIISSILSDNNARTPAFGPNSSLKFSDYTISVKTGTTNDYRDGWTIGYNPKVVVGVWLGNNDNTPMHNIPGSMGAAKIFNPLMNYLIKEKGMYAEIDMPPDIISKSCYAGKVEYFIKGSDTTKGCYKTLITSGTPSPSISEHPVP